MNRTEQLQARVAELRAAPTPTHDLVDALNELGNYLFPINIEEGRALALQAESLARELHYSMGVGYAQVTLGFITYWEGDANDALKQAQQLWSEYSEVLDDFRLRGAIQELHAASYHRMGQVGNALAHALIALDLYDRAEDKDGMGTVLNLIGICYGWLDDPISATPYLEQALKLHLELKDDRRVVMMWGNLAWNYLRGGQAARAYNAIVECQTCYDLYIESHHRPPYPDFPVYLNLNWAWTLEAAGEYDRAMVAVSAGKATNLREDGTLMAPGLHCALLRVQANIYTKREQYAEAVATLTEGLTLATNHNILREQAGLHEALAHAYKQVGDYANAFNHHQWFHTQDKQLFSTRTAEQVAKLRTMLETQAARREAELLGAKRRELELLVKELQTLHAQVQDLSIRDSLTGLYNRRYLDEQLVKLIAHARQNYYAFSVIMADIDDFKLINDRYRHQMGDAVLRVLGRLLQSVVAGHTTNKGEPAPFAARYGGEEFVLVLPRIDKVTARFHAETFRHIVEVYPWDNLGPGLKVTVSGGVWGVDSMSTYMHPDELLRRADDAMYQAKRLGKNQVV
jgi:two-component system cell cycle response regulator